MFASSMAAFFGWFRGNHNDRLNCDVYSPTAKIDARLPLQASGDFKLDRNARVKFRISEKILDLENLRIEDLKACKLENLNA